MHRETIAVHAGFDHDPATRAAAVPIYQTLLILSTAPITGRPCLISKFRDIATAALVIQRTLFWKQGWPRLKTALKLLPSVPGKLP